MIRPLNVLAALVIAVCALASGCASSQSSERWTDATVEAASETVLWQVTVLSLEKTGFPVGSGVERGKLVAVSGWHTSLAPFKSDGYRERCHIEYASVGERQYSIKVRVEREHNEDISHPLDISYAEWKPDPDDVSRAQTVLGYIKATLNPKFETTKQQTP